MLRMFIVLRYGPVVAGKVEVTISNSSQLPDQKGSGFAQLDVTVRLISFRIVYFNAGLEPEARAYNC
jgi:hypothetical protein